MLFVLPFTVLFSIKFITVLYLTAHKLLFLIAALSSLDITIHHPIISLLRDFIPHQPPYNPHRIISHSTDGSIRHAAPLSQSLKEILQPISAAPQMVSIFFVSFLCRRNVLF